MELQEAYSDASEGSPISCRNEIRLLLLGVQMKTPLHNRVSHSVNAECASERRNGHETENNEQCLPPLKICLKSIDRNKIGLEKPLLCKCSTSS